MIIYYFPHSSYHLKFKNFIILYKSVPTTKRTSERLVACDVTRFYDASSPGNRGCKARAKRIHNDHFNLKINQNTVHVVSLTAIQYRLSCTHKCYLFN